MLSYNLELVVNIISFVEEAFTHGTAGTMLSIDRAPQVIRWPHVPCDEAGCRMLPLAVAHQPNSWSQGAGAKTEHTFGAECNIHPRITSC